MKKVCKRLKKRVVDKIRIQNNSYKRSQSPSEKDELVKFVPASTENLKRKSDKLS
jgi:hypothetical protein